MNQQAYVSSMRKMLTHWSEELMEYMLMTLTLAETPDTQQKLGMIAALEAEIEARKVSKLSKIEQARTSSGKLVFDMYLDGYHIGMVYGYTAQKAREALLTLNAGVYNKKACSNIIMLPSYNIQNSPETFTALMGVTPDEFNLRTKGR